MESVPACIKKVSRPEYKVSCSCKLLVKSLAKSYLACSKSVLTKFMLLYLYCGTEEKYWKFSTKGQAFQTELANSVAVINSVATISVQLLFKGGHNSAYTCIDC